MSEAPSGWSRPTIRRLIGFVGLLSLIAVGSRWVDFGEIPKTVARAEWRPLILAALVTVALTLGAARKVQLAFGLSGLRLTYLKALQGVLTAATLNPFLPGRGGDLIKALVLAPVPAQRPAAVAAVVLERLVDLMTVAVWATVAGGLAGERLVAGLGLTLALGLAAVVLVGSRLRHLLPAAIEGATRNLAALVAHREQTFGLLSATWAVWSGNLMVAVLCLYATGVRPPLAEALSASAVGLLAGMVPISVAGLGTREAGLLLVLGSAVEPERVVASGVLYMLLTVGLPWAVGSPVLAFAPTLWDR